MRLITQEQVRQITLDYLNFQVWNYSSVDKLQAPLVDIRYYGSNILAHKWRVRDKNGGFAWILLDRGRSGTHLLDFAVVHTYTIPQVTELIKEVIGIKYEAN